MISECNLDIDWGAMTKAKIFNVASDVRNRPYIHALTQINTLRPRQNGRHFADDIFKRIFFNENVWISIKISLKFVPKGPINIIPAMFRIMAWRRPGDKPLSEAMLVSLLTHICVTRPQWVNTLYFRFLSIIVLKAQVRKALKLDPPGIIVLNLSSMSRIVFKHSPLVCYWWWGPQWCFSCVGIYWRLRILDIRHPCVCVSWQDWVVHMKWLLFER